MFNCYFNCGAKFESKNTKEALLWSWFTGYGTYTVYFCPTCKVHRKKEMGRLREKLYTKSEIGVINLYPY